MLAIVTPCDQPDCGGHVHFELPDLDEWEGRLLGSCDACRTTYTLYGGERRPVQPPAPSPRPTVVAGRHRHG